MSYEIIALPLFALQLKKLGKKYPKIKEDYEDLLDKLEDNPKTGNRIPGFQVPLYKIRMISRDQKKGKRGGYRVVYYFAGNDNFIYLVTIYPKAQQENFDRNLIIKALKRENLL